MRLNIDKIRSDFPILREKVNGNPLIYFDNAATTQKPQVMIDELVRYYSSFNANIHRGVHTLSQRATAAYEETRHFIAQLYHCREDEVIFTKSDTEALNLLAYSLSHGISQEENIVITESEHHSNIVPWQLVLGKANGAEVTTSEQIRFVEFDENGFIDIEDLKSKIDSNTKILSCTWASNSFGAVNDIKEIIQVARSKNPNMKIIVDAAQYLPHNTFNFKELDADFITFSAHKLCGPTGLGVLIGKYNLLESMPPFLGGGDMIREVTTTRTTFADVPYKFEAGTPNIADVIAFGKSLEYLDTIGWNFIYEYEQELAHYLLEKLQSLEFVEIYGLKATSDNELLKRKLALVSFNVKGVHAHDVGTILDDAGIAVRTGHHCTQPIMQKLAIPASVRASLYIYNTKVEIDLLVENLKKVYNVFN